MPSSISEDEQILAAGYVLGDLSTSESLEFESALATNPALKAEVEALQIAFNLLPQDLPQVIPPPPLKAKLLDAFTAESNSDLMLNSTPVAVPNPSTETTRKLPWSKVFAGIGLLIGGLLLVDNFRLRQELQLAQQVDLQDLATVIQQPKSRLVALSNRENKAVGNILFTPGKWQKVIVSAQNLPPLPVDRVYRMWLELNNGQILPCGEFTTDASGNVFVKLNAKQNPPTGVKAKGVFVTIDRPDAPLQPTGERVIQGTI
jgi:Anti-sigma-K factor rskA